MNNLTHAIDTFYYLEQKAHESHTLQQLHPLTKLICTLFYIGFIVSYPPTVFFPLLTMSSYLIMTFLLASASFKRCLCQVKGLLFLICAIGLFNPLFDRTLLLTFGPFHLTRGMLTMFTLMLKGCFAVLASYLLIASTSMEAICYALSCLHIPDFMISSLLLSYRHLLLLLGELQSMSHGYHLRAIKQKGLHIKAWGSFVGYFLLRSIDHANDTADSMLLRGYHGQLTVKPSTSPLLLNALYLCFWLLLFLILRFI